MLQQFTNILLFIKFVHNAINADMLCATYVATVHEYTLKKESELGNAKLSGQK
jgi:hypothetical protein